MFSASDFRQIVSGQRRGIQAALLRAGLAAAEWPYALAMEWRNGRFDRHPSRVQYVGVPVVSVGNLTLGGTGKTPLVAWIARWYRQHDVRVAIVSRGYGAEAGARNDEAIELEQRLADVPHLQNPDRVEAARTAIEELESQLIVLDDGFQHRRIGRDLDIVLLDALEPFGFEHVFPRGTLRERPQGLRRAQVVVLSRADMLAAEERAGLRTRVEHYAPQAAWVEARHHPRTLLSHLGVETPLPALQGQPVAAFCGIGNPGGFRHTLQSSGYQVVGFRDFPDHHAYTRDDIASLSRWVENLDVAAVVCTHKDLVKLRLDHLGRSPLWALVVEFDLLTGQQALEEHLQRLLPQP